MISLALFALSGFFFAVMDRVENEVAFNNSVFRNLNPRWWCKSVSWQYVGFIPMTEYRPDAWHMSKSLAFVAIALGAALRPGWFAWYFMAPLFAVVITASFVAFYSHILKRPAS